MGSLLRKHWFHAMMTLISQHIVMLRHCLQPDRQSLFSYHSDNLLHARQRTILKDCSHRYQ